jgi:hypothetical protein
MGRPEAVILDQLPVDSWDLFIGMLWKRFGTPSGGRDPETGRYYNSGTQEEFWLAYRSSQKSQRPHMLIYRRTSPLPDDVDLEQLAQVRAFWKEFDAAGEHPGLVQSYKTPTAFERRVRNDLIKVLPMLVGRLRNPTAPTPGALAAHLPANTIATTTDSSNTPTPAPTTGGEGIITDLYLPPKTYTRLVGRSVELDRVMQAIRERTGKLVIAIVGLGGIGKTTLAREAMERALQEQLFTYAVWASAKTERFVGEGAVKTGVSTYSFDDLLADIGRQCHRLDIATMPSEQRIFAVQALLAKQRVLIVMDNLETVPEYDALVDNLFQILGNSKLLITSRHQVKHDYVFTINLGGFLVDEGVTFLREEGRERGINAVAQAERKQLVEIHEVTGGAPLAMKLVVGQLSRQPIQVVLTTLQQASSKGQDYEFYRFVYQHTWNLLSDTARMALVDMSVFPPIHGGTLQDVEAVSQLDPTNFWPAMDQLILMSLVDKVGQLGQDRFALHPLTQYFILADITQEWDDS